MVTRSGRRLVYACLQSDASSARIPSTSVLAVLLPVLLLAGIWLGGHPEHLPGFLRNSFVADHQTRVVDEAIQRIARDYYRPVSAGQLVGRLDRGCRREPRRPLLALPQPERIPRIQHAAALHGHRRGRRT